MASRVRPRRWTRLEYERLVDSGAFRPDERLELVGGQLVVREPQGSRHAVAVELALHALQRVFGTGWRVRVQLPVAVDDESEPEPDLSVVPGDPRDSTSGHPSRAALVVEVADSSLAFDREDKGSLYARAGLAEYWLVNLVDMTVEVYREPLVDPTAVYGWRYGSRLTLVPPASVVPLAMPRGRVLIADLLL